MMMGSPNEASEKWVGGRKDPVDCEILGLCENKEPRQDRHEEKVLFGKAYGLSTHNRVKNPTS